MLAPSSGLDGGLMMVQYTAAALVSDNKTLAHPDSVDSIPSCANQEDHVSMGANAARHALEILANVRTVLAIELQTAAQAIDLRCQGRVDQLGKRYRIGASRTYKTLRDTLTDRFYAPARAIRALLKGSREKRVNSSFIWALKACFALFRPWSFIPLTIRILS